VATVVRCADQLRHVYSTVASVERQTAGAREIVLVTDDSTPQAGREWLAAFSGRRGHTIAHAGRSTPGAVRNAGIRATRAPFVLCIDAGDRLDPRCHETAAAALDREPDVDVVTSSVHVFGPGSAERIVIPPGADLDA